MRATAPKGWTGVSRNSWAQTFEWSTSYISHISYIYIYNFYCPIRISSKENVGCFPRGKPAVTESCYPTYGACWVFSCFHNPPNSERTTGSLLCAQMLMHAIAHRGAWSHVRESALRADSGRKIPCHTRELNLRQWCAGLMLHQLGATYPPPIHSWQKGNHKVPKISHRVKFCCWPSDYKHFSVQLILHFISIWLNKFSADIVKAGRGY